MSDKKSFQAFNKNISTFLDTLKSEGFVLNVTEYEDDTIVDIEERIEQKTKALRTMDINGEFTHQFLSTSHWSKKVNEHESVYVHLFFENATHMSKTTSVYDVKVLVNDERNALGSKEYRFTTMPSKNVLLKKITTITENLIEKTEKSDKSSQLRKRNVPVFEKRAIEVFGSEAKITTSSGNWAVTIEYKGAKIYLLTEQDSDLVTFDSFGIKKEVTIEKARMIIDMIND